MYDLVNGLPVLSKAPKSYSKAPAPILLRDGPLVSQWLTHAQRRDFDARIESSFSQPRAHIDGSRIPRFVARNDIAPFICHLTTGILVNLQNRIQMELAYLGDSIREMR